MPLIGLFQAIYSCSRWSKDSKKRFGYFKEAQSRITKELDLQKFLHRQRVFTTSALGLMTGNQASFVDKFSQLAVAIHESTDSGSTSQDDELDELGIRAEQYIGEMLHSKKAVDKRLLNLYKLR